MCGLAGIYNFSSLAPVKRPDIEGMTRLLAHRGPDDEGFYFSHAFGVGHRRLSILDRSQRGHQPMCTADGRFVIAYNGEVFNYLELKHALEADGYVARSNSDTEIILQLYASKGVKCLEELNGMFAIAIWDSLERTLFLARDRVGIKPLYYSITEDGIVFASEIKSLFASRLLRPRVRTDNLDAYLTFAYVPGRETLFEEVLRVLPGEWMLVSRKGVRKATYWDVNYQPDFARSSEQTAEELRELLLDSMRIHLRSDVPVGVFLSGGLDSSTTVALLSARGVKNLSTFSVAHEMRGADRYDETKYARIVADRFRTDHHVLYINPDQFLDCIPRFIWYMDEPVAEGPALSFYLVAKLLREHVTVALSGEGADELFAGYSVYRRMCWLERYRRLPEALRSGIKPLLGAIGTPKVRKYWRFADLPLERRYRGVFNSDSTVQDALYSDDLRAIAAKRPPDDLLAPLYLKTQKHDPLTRMLYADLKTWLVDDLLAKADRMTMANSVELRVPFLDYRVIEYAATIPSGMKLHHGQVKWILKRAMRDHLPERTLRRTKRGFPIPLALMLGRDLLTYVKDLLLSPTCLDRGYFKRNALEELIQETASGKAEYHTRLWQLIVLEEWHRRFIDSSRSNAFCEEPFPRTSAVA